MKKPEVIERLSSVKLANAITVGGQVEVYLDDKRYHILLIDDLRIHISPIMSPNVGVTTHIDNAICWTSDYTHYLNEICHKYCQKKSESSENA